MKKSIVIIGSGIAGLCMGALLVKQGFDVTIYEKSSFVGGRTKSSVYKNHILDNGFHIMPFYKTSAVYKLLEEIGIVNDLKLAKVNDIAFYENKKYHKYPKGITDILKFSLLPLSGRISLLKVMLPMAFSSVQKSEKYDNTSMMNVIGRLDRKTRAFFDAVCILAFADSPEHVALGEFMRMIIRANPFKGGTSELAYPAEGGYDTICKLVSNYITEKGGKIHLGQAVKQVKVQNNKVTGVILQDGNLVESDCVIVTHPAYLAIRELFEPNILDKSLQSMAKKLEKTTSVIEAHFCCSDKLDSRQLVFPVGDYMTKGIFFVTNIASSVSPKGEYLIMAGAPVPSEDTENPQKIKELTQKMKEEISEIYPNFTKSLIWERSMAWKLVESVVKEPGLVWKQKFPHETNISGLFFVGDSTISYGIGTDSAAQSSFLCYPKILKHLQ